VEPGNEAFALGPIFAVVDRELRAAVLLEPDRILVGRSAREAEDVLEEARDLLALLAEGEHVGQRRGRRHLEELHCQSDSFAAAEAQGRNTAALSARSQGVEQGHEESRA